MRGTDVDEDITVRATEAEIASAIAAAGGGTPQAVTIRRLAFERDRLRECLQKIAGHSVCCDARHLADAALDWEGLPPDLSKMGVQMIDIGGGVSSYDAGGRKPLRRR
jgi:hypothetical protein